MASVDLGSLDWTYQTEEVFQRFYSEDIDNMKGAINSATKGNFLSSKTYDVSASANTLSSSSYNNVIGISDDSSAAKKFFIKNTAYTDASTFKATLSGIYATYELATPVETTITTTATLAEVSAIRTNDGMISVQGNTNEDYAQPDVSEIVCYQQFNGTAQQSEVTE